MNPVYIFVAAICFVPAAYALAFPTRSKNRLRSVALRWPPWSLRGPSPRQVTIEYYARMVCQLLAGVLLLWLGLSDWHFPDSWKNQFVAFTIWGISGCGLVTIGALRIAKSNEYGQVDFERVRNSTGRLASYNSQFGEQAYARRAFWIGIVLLIIGGAILAVLALAIYDQFAPAG